MFVTLFQSVNRKGIAAGLAALVATAGIGVAVAAPSDAPDQHSAFAIGAPDGINEIVDDATSGVKRRVDVPVVPPVVEDDAETELPEQDVKSALPASGASRAAPLTSVAPPVDANDLRPGGDRFDQLLQGLVPDDADRAAVADGVEELAQEVVARIQQCVASVVGEFGSGYDFGGFDQAGDRGFAAGGSAGTDESFATSIVDDVLPCVSGLVDDALRCVSGLVDEILAAVMSMDFGEMAGLAGVIADELVDCVGEAQPD
jgi:hypothetical protein